ncbi:MAG: bifunctional phosphoribosyl-AMP cyclohydrolase/phosphoribosyl-ATP diphosphatase HisIE [Xanthomonadales bacterium]|nr:bifunctional phosphoribosyl-AMP cyclohydrolase/phosphoribosyl-ATP diphosphatase HisIE [Xanthomonadales bacterium]
MSTEAPQVDLRQRLAGLNWSKQDGLIPAVVQDVHSLRVLMLGYLSEESLAETLRCGDVVFFSRSRQKLWRKGETSGHTLRWRDIRVDCDADTVLVLVEPQGPTCHLGRTSCFPEAPGAFLGALERIIASRRAQAESKSYTSSLFEAGTRRIAQKVGEEGVETALAAVVQDDDTLIDESADLVFHLLVLLQSRGLDLQQVQRRLESRHAARAAPAS